MTFNYGTPKIDYTPSDNFAGKDILDITAGYRNIWQTFAEYLPPINRVVFLDKRPEVQPDIIADNEHIPFPEKTFNFVVYDPPHLALNDRHYYKTEFGKRFWAFKNKTEMLGNLQAVNIEAFRVLKDDGTLILKWSEGDRRNRGLPILTVLKYLSNFKKTQHFSFSSKSHAKCNKTHLIFLKKQLEPTQ